MSDIYADVTPGTSFDLAVKTPNSTQNTCIDDAGKAALLYAQIHKLANQCPNESILFDFYDDRGLDVWEEGDDVLEYLHSFFTKHPELLPNNMTLRLNHYEGAAVTPYTDIKGTGFIDENYQQTTKDLAETSQHGCRHIPKIDPSNLTGRKALALPATYTASAEEKETSFPVFSATIPLAKNRPNSPITSYLGAFFYQLGFNDEDIRHLEAEVATFKDATTTYIKDKCGL